MVEEMEESRAYIVGEGETPAQVVDHVTAWAQARFWARMDANPAARGHVVYKFERGAAFWSVERSEWAEQARRMLEDGEVLDVRAEVVYLGRPDEYLAVVLAV